MTDWSSMLNPYTAKRGDVLENTLPETQGFPKGRDFAPRADMIFVKKYYATAVLGARMLRKKHVNRDISQFATKERKCFKMA